MKSNLGVKASGRESKGVTSIKILHHVLETEMRLPIMAKISQLVAQRIVIEVQDVIQMMLTLLWRSAGDQKIG